MAVEKKWLRDRMTIVEGRLRRDNRPLTRSQRAVVRAALSDALVAGYSIGWTEAAGPKRAAGQ